MSRKKRKPSPMTTEGYWEWRAKRARVMRWEELVLALAIVSAFAIIGLAVVLFS